MSISQQCEFCKGGERDGLEKGEGYKLWKMRGILEQQDRKNGRREVYLERQGWRE